MAKRRDRSNRPTVNVGSCLRGQSVAISNAQCTLTPQIGRDKHKHQGNNGKCLVVDIAHKTNKLKENRLFQLQKKCFRKVPCTTVLENSNFSLILVAGAAIISLLLGKSIMALNLKVNPYKVGILVLLVPCLQFSN